MRRTFFFRPPLVCLSSIVPCCCCISVRVMLGSGVVGVAGVSIRLCVVQMPIIFACQPSKVQAISDNENLSAVYAPRPLSDIYHVADWNVIDE